MVYSILIGFMLLLFSAIIDASENVLKYNYSNTWLRYYIKKNVGFKRFWLRFIKYLTCITGYSLLGLALLCVTSLYMMIAMIIFIFISRLIYILLYNYLVNVTFKI